MDEPALVRVGLSDPGQLLVPDQLPHVGGTGLAYDLPPGHPASVHVVAVNNLLHHGLGHTRGQDASSTTGS